MDYIKTIDVPKRELMRWNDLLRSKRINYHEQGFAKFSTVWCKTVVFANGRQVDIKVNTNTPEDGDVWAEAVLFTATGSQISFTEPSYELDGPLWILYDGDDTYNVQVVGV